MQVFSPVNVNVAVNVNENSTLGGFGYLPEGMSVC